jgi:hypothetical protein
MLRYDESVDRYGISADEADEILGTAVLLLDAEGEIDAADLLASGELLVPIDEYVSEDYAPDFHLAYDTRLRVHPQIFKEFTSEVVEKVNTAVRTAAAGHRPGMFASLEVHPAPVKGNWRLMREQDVAAGVTNQASRVSPPRAGFIEHAGYRFRDRSEIAVFDALVKVQISFPRTDTIAFVPNVPVAVLGHHPEVDFIVTYRGRVGALEIDGDSHRGATRYAADQSKHALLGDAGFQHVHRIPVEDTGDSELLDEHLRTFLARLTAR